MLQLCKEKLKIFGDKNSKCSKSCENEYNEPVEETNFSVTLLNDEDDNANDLDADNGPKQSSLVTM